MLVHVLRRCAHTFAKGILKGVPTFRHYPSPASHLRLSLSGTGSIAMPNIPVCPAANNSPPSLQWHPGSRNLFRICSTTHGGMRIRIDRPSLPYLAKTHFRYIWYRAARRALGSELPNGSGCSAANSCTRAQMLLRGNIYRAGCDAPPALERHGAGPQARHASLPAC
jgi:hypothetical protein